MLLLLLCELVVFWSCVAKDEDLAAVVVDELVIYVSSVVVHSLVPVITE